ncbi:unnamed protein product [Ostreobium quekettii]|uniref:methenyltetrahydrofolate cyclohydrolase n=1 Tax=Ostreobium quekettii TaxID=121088 RepID=A0A8S1JAS4_9CHLO|nr:unnamed protein product [Ostreobium quekettii]
MHTVQRDSEHVLSQRGQGSTLAPVMDGQNRMVERGRRAKVLDGRQVAREWNLELKAEADRLAGMLGRKPALCVILVGNRPDSVLYVKKKEEISQEVGIDTHVVRLEASISMDGLRGAVKSACRDPAMDGVLVQLPLPRSLDEEGIMCDFDPQKDVDGFHVLNMGRMLMRNRSPRFIPCTALGCMRLLDWHRIDVHDKTAVVVGDSNIVGLPLSTLLRDRGTAIVTVCHGASYRECFDDGKAMQQKRVAASACHPPLPGPSMSWGLHACGPSSQEPACGDAAIAAQFHDYRLPEITRTADILVVAVGHPNLVQRNWVKPGAVVLDIGINVTPYDGANLEDCHADYHLTGDVAFEEVSEIASAISPVPGGVGPMTTSSLMHNTLLAARHRCAGDW